MSGVGRPAVLAEGLYKRFGPVVALDGVDLAVPPGGVLALLGPNGAGKTTTVRILATLLRPDAGHVEVAGHDLGRDTFALRNSIGLAGQLAAVDENLTGRENLELFARLHHVDGNEAGRRADALLERFELEAAAGRLARTYSGGMRRRLDLAAALVGRPPVLFLDEPTAGLDPRSRRVLWDVVNELVAEGTTVLLTTQYLEEADHLATEVAVIDGGRVIADGTADELKLQLGGHLLEVDLVDGGDLGAAASAIAPLAAADAGFEVDPARMTVAVKMPAAPDGAGGDRPSIVVQALRRLDAAGVAVADLALRHPTLDDVFLALTGRPAEAGTDGHRGPGGSGTAAWPTRPPRHTPAPSRQRRHPPGGSLRPGPRWVVGDAVAVARRNLLRYVRVPRVLVFSFLQPVVYLLIFTHVFRGAIAVPRLGYVDFLLPGIFVQTVVLGSTQTAAGLARDLNLGIIDRFRSLPMARSAVLAGRTLADCLRNLAVLVLMLVEGLLLGFRFHAGLLAAAAALGLLLLLGLAFSWTTAAIGIVTRDVDTAQLAGLIWLFPLTFVSSAFVPLASMSGWVAAFARANPVTHGVDAVRALCLGGPTAGPLVAALAWSAALLAVFVPVAVACYRRTT